MTPTVRLRDVGSTYGGLTGKTKADFGRGDASFVTFLEVINSTRLRGRALEQVRVAKGERQNRVMRRDLLFNGSSETPGEVALSAVVDFDPSTSTFLNSFCFGFRLRPGAPVDPTYLAYFFRSSAGRSLVSSLAQGATRYNIAKTKFLDVQLALPSIEYQREIVDSLSDTDDMIAALERLIAKKRAIKQGVMQHLLTGGTRLPSFSGAWHRLAVASRSVVKARIGWQGLTTNEYRNTGTYRLVGGTEFVDGRIDWGRTPFVDKWRYDQDTYIQLRVGDVLLTKDGTIGKTAYVDALPGPATLNSGVFVIRPTRQAYDPAFLYWMLRSRAFDEFLGRLTAGSTISHLYQRDLVTLVLEVPPTIEEQQAIAGVIGDAEAEVSKLQERLAKARSLRTGMMQQLLTGRVRLPAETTG